MRIGASLNQSCTMRTHNPPLDENNESYQDQSQLSNLNKMLMINIAFKETILKAGAPHIIFF